MKYKTCICDVCEKSVWNEHDLVSVRLPREKNSYKIVDSYTVQPTYRYVQAKELEICQECAKKLVKGYREYLGIDINEDGLAPWKGE